MKPAVELLFGSGCVALFNIWHRYCAVLVGLKNKKPRTSRGLNMLKPSYGYGITEPLKSLYATTKYDSSLYSLLCKYAMESINKQIIFKKHSIEHMVIQHRNIENKGAFFIDQDGDTVAELDYSLRADDQMILNHTEVDDELRGRNVGFELVHAAVEYARKHNYKIVPICPFAKAVIDRKPDFQDVLA